MRISDWSSDVCSSDLAAEAAAEAPAADHDRHRAAGRGRDDHGRERRHWIGQWGRISHGPRSERGYGRHFAFGRLDELGSLDHLHSLYALPPVVAFDGAGLRLLDAHVTGGRVRR